MKMKKGIRIIAVFLSFVALLSFSGCSFIGLDVTELIKPPKASGDKASIQKVIDEVAGSDYILKYPAAGDNRSSITMTDIDGDDKEEALCFVCIDASTDNATTHLLIIDQTGKDKWECINDFTKDNSDIDRLDLADINGDGMTDILVGYSTYIATQNQLMAYMGTENNFSEVTIEDTYSTLALDSYASKDKADIILISMATTEANAYGELLVFDKKDITKYNTYKCDMDGNINQINNVTSGLVNASQFGIVIDGVTNNNTYNTQVLYYNSSEKALLNPLYESSDNGVLVSERSTSIISKDFDDDGTIEIPTDRQLPYESSNDMALYAFETSWNEINLQSNSLNYEGSYIINEDAGFSFLIPAAWTGEYTAKYNSNGDVLTFNRAVVSGTATDVVGEIFSIAIVSADDWKTYENKDGYKKITEEDDTIFGYKINSKTPYVVTQSLVEKNFSLLSEKSSDSSSSK